MPQGNPVKIVDLYKYARLGHEHFAKLLDGCTLHPLPALPDPTPITDPITRRDTMAKAFAAQHVAAANVANTGWRDWGKCQCAQKFYLGRDVPRIAGLRYIDLLDIMHSPLSMRTDLRLRDRLYELTIWTDCGGIVPGPAPDFTTGIHIAQPRR